MIWNKKALQSQEVGELSRKFGMDSLSASILIRRGISDPAEICYFLEDDLRFLHNPFLFNDMEILVDRLQQAVEEEEKVLVFGDRDVDGITSTVMLVEGLRDLGLDPEWRVPVEDEPYGLTLEAVEEWAAEEGTLILTVDNGITCHRETLRAAELGIDLIILDHHEAQAEGRPPALAVLDPKLEGENYPFRDLAGCGVVSRVLWALALSRSPVYNQCFVLLHPQMLEGDIQLDMTSVCNLLPGESMQVLASQGEAGREKILAFLQGRPLLVYEKGPALAALRQFFGPHTDIALEELAPRLAALSSSFAGKTLDQLAAKSRTRLYGLGGDGPTDVLSSLFITLLYRQESSLFQTWLRCLDLAALGTVADMMPLLDENRILVKRGLDQLNRTERKSLRELLLRQKLLGKPVTSKDVSWSLSPWLNSAGRMKRADLAVSFLLEQEDSRIFERAEEISELNRQRREMGEKAWQQHLQEAETSRASFDQKLVMVVSDQIPRGITGFLATRYCKFFHLPVVVLARQDDILSGSLRSPGGFPLQNYIAHFSELMDDWGGHEFAAGFSMPQKNYEAFRKGSRKYVEKWEGPAEEEESLDIDAELPHAYLNEDLQPLVEALGPYGEGFPPITFCARSVVVEKVNLVGKDSSHVKLLLKTDENVKWPGLMWNSVDRYRKDFRLNDRVDVLFHLEENYFRNQRTLQWNILDIQRSQTLEA